MRVLLDTNIFISYLLTPRKDSPIIQIVPQGLLGDFVLLFPENLLEELKSKAENEILDKQLG